MLRNVPGFVKKVLPFLREAPKQDQVAAPLPANARIRRPKRRHDRSRKWWLRRRARMHMARESRRRNR